jgi:hypothetical protein
MQAALATARRAQDQLPPVLTYRRGLIAGFELWVKRTLKTATRWFTWEQANFNAATVTSLDSTAKLLAQVGRELSELRSSIANQAEAGEKDGSIPRVPARLAALEETVQALATEIHAERAEHSKRIDLLMFQAVGSGDFGNGDRGGSR